MFLSALQQAKQTGHLNLSNTFLTNEKANLLHFLEPDENFWNQIEIVDLIGNENLSILPLFLGKLQIEKIKSIFIDFPTNLSPHQIIQLISRFYKILNFFYLSNLNLTDVVGSILPIQHLSFKNEIKIVNLKGNSFSMLPSSLGWLNANILENIIIEEEKLSLLDQKYLQEAKQSGFSKLLQYLHLSLESGRIQVREIKVMLVGSSHAGKTSLREELRSISSSKSPIQPKFKSIKIKRTDGIDLIPIHLPKSDIQCLFWGNFSFCFHFHF